LESKCVPDKNGISLEGSKRNDDKKALMSPIVPLENGIKASDCLKTKSLRYQW
jgi:hypothetical protein